MKLRRHWRRHTSRHITSNIGTHMNTFNCARARAHTHTRTHTHIYIYIRTHVHIHSQVLLSFVCTHSQPSNYPPLRLYCNMLQAYVPILEVINNKSILFLFLYLFIHSFIYLFLLIIARVVSLKQIFIGHILRGDNSKENIWEMKKRERKEKYERKIFRKKMWGI